MLLWVNTSSGGIAKAIPLHDVLGYDGGTVVPVGIYTRLSRDRDGTQTATARQAADCRDYCERNGLDPVEVYEDTDLSGSKRGVVRPDYERMLADLAAGTIRGIVVWKLDRLSRQPGQFEAVVTACERVGARVHSVNDPADMTSPAGLAMMRVGMAFGALEAENIALRTRRAKQEAAEAGLPNGGGRRAYGVTANGREVVPEEAERIREAARRVIGGESLLSICRDWQGAGVLTPRGRVWAPGSLREMLTSPRLAGKRLHRGEVFDSDVIPAILTDEESAAVRHILLDPTRRSGPVGRVRLLTGILRCGRCGTPMLGRNRKDKTPIYSCHTMRPGRPSCGRVSIAGALADELVSEAVLAFYETPEVVAALAEARAGGAWVALSRAIAEDEAALERLAVDHYVERVIGRAEFVAAREGIERRLGGNRVALDRLHAERVVAGGGSVREAWEASDTPGRRAIIRAAVEEVVVAPVGQGGNRFRRERVRIVWRERDHEAGDVGRSGAGG